jgi:hypothetical protein
VPHVEVTHVNLNDGVVEGLRCTDVPAFSVQHHPEAGPGPHDASYLFADFASLVRKDSLSRRTRRRPPAADTAAATEQVGSPAVVPAPEPPDPTGPPVGPSGDGREG